MRPNLAVLRSSVLPMLTEAGQIRRITGYEWNEESGFEEPVYETVLDGPILIRPDGINNVQTPAGEWAQERYDVTMPANTAAAVGDLLTVTACPFEPALIGQEISLVDVPRDAWAVATFAKGERRI